MAELNKILQQALSELSSEGFSGRKATAVFDLDSTLFDVTPRLRQILHDFAAHPQFQVRFPESCALLKNAEVHHKDWGIKQALIRAGLDGHHPDFHKAVKEFWIQSFFSNEYLHFDQPYPGAIEFVNSVQKTGAEIVYLTGRDIPRQGIGTAEVLKKWGFPIQPPQCRMVLKPQAGLDDAEFKEAFFRQYPKTQSIWLFENEPVNVNRIRQHHPHVKLVFVDSVHAGKENPPEDVPQILHFILKDI
jgi:hypothetical protein